MIKFRTLNELHNGPLLISESAICQAEAFINQIRGDVVPPDPSVLTFSVARNNMVVSNSITSGNDFDSFEENSIIILPIIGLMLKYSAFDWNEYRYIYGMDIIADLINLASASNKISGIILMINTPGGTTQSIFQLEIALRNCTKPCVALIDGGCHSGGMYVASFCDKIMATHKMCSVGNIGAMAQIVDRSKLQEEQGIKIISVYPPESKWKNKAFREALDGNEELLIKEDLSPFAIHFQEIIKENRKKLDTSVEGILEGRDFYVYDAIKNGLIDGIMNLDETIQLVQKLNQENKEIFTFN